MANSSDQTSYPVVSFYFQVAFSGIPSGPDNAFQEVQGLSTEVGLDEIKEGGENRFTYRVPSRLKFQNITLKRGMLAKNSKLVTWCKKSLSGEYDQPIKPKTVTITLMNEKKAAVRTWNVVNAYPVKWQVSDFNAMENKLAIESIELAFNYFTTQ